jgi:hypothetical protein
VKKAALWPLFLSCKKCMAGIQNMPIVRRSIKVHMDTNDGAESSDSPPSVEFSYRREFDISVTSSP